MDMANEILRDTYKGNKSIIARLSERPLEDLRRAIVTAKRFELDESMSEFLAVISNTPFRVAPERRSDVLDSLRHSAKLPFPKMFFQFDNFCFRRKLLQIEKMRVDFWGDSLISPDNAPEWAKDDGITAHIGFLLEQDPADEHLIWVTEFTAMRDEGTMMPLPIAYAYRTDDGLFHPRHNLKTEHGVFAHGITGADTQQIGVRVSDNLIKKFGPQDFVKYEVQEADGSFKQHVVPKLIPEFGGNIRYVLAFLATLTNVPKMEREVRTSKGFMGKGQIRKYQDHTVLTLSLPRKMTMETLGARLIAQARKGWHEVMPHWRVYHKGQFFCSSRNLHIWPEEDETGHAKCKLCDAKRVWIVLPNGRGDPTISVRTHMYKVTHPDRS